MLVHKDKIMEYVVQKTREFHNLYFTPIEALTQKAQEIYAVLEHDFRCGNDRNGYGNMNNLSTARKLMSASIGETIPYPGNVYYLSAGVMLYVTAKPNSHNGITCHVPLLVINDSGQVMTSSGKVYPSFSREKGVVRPALSSEIEKFFSVWNPTLTDMSYVDAVFRDTLEAFADRDINDNDNEETVPF